MSEETQNDGSWSGLMKTIIGTVGTIVTAGGAYVGSQLFGGEEAQTAQPTQAAAPVINITNANQQQAAPANKTVIVHQAAPAAQAAPAPAPKKKTEKEALQEEPKW
jgi:flagellar basal body-associated protein FliL